MVVASCVPDTLPPCCSGSVEVLVTYNLGNVFTVVAHPQLLPGNHAGKVAQPVQVDMHAIVRQSPTSWGVCIYQNGIGCAHHRAAATSLWLLLLR